MKAGTVGGRNIFRFGVICLLEVFSLVFLVAGQGLVQTSYAQSAMESRAGLDLAPSNPLAMPGSTGGFPTGSDSVYLSSRILRDLLPAIPNLEVGYLWDFGSRRDRSSRVTLDYLLPVSLGRNFTAFGEVHGESTNFWNTLKSILRWESDHGRAVIGGKTRFVHYDNIGSHIASPDRLDLSLGAGCRRIMGNDLFFGINCFYDTTRLQGTWYSSGSFGLETVALISGNDALDLNFNWYGALFTPSVLINAFRRGLDNFDVEAGYSRELFNGGPDLRLKLNAYKFSVGTPVYGWTAGAELKSRDGVFSVKYETGDDRINSRYHTIGGSVSLGLQLERLLSWESPFVMPEPIFQSPRNLRYLLSRKVVRRFSQPAAAVLARNGRAYVVGDRVYSTLTRQAPVSGTYRYNYAANVYFYWLTDPPNTGSRFMSLTANIDRSQVDPAGAGHVEITIFRVGGYISVACWTRVTFFDTSHAAITTTPAVRSPSMPPDGYSTFKVDLSAANMAALAQPGADVESIGIEVQTTNGTATWEVRSTNPAVIFLNE